MARQADHEQRRRQFAAAALAVISRDGLEGLTMRNVAKEAGFTTGALTHYFQSKDEVLIAVSEHGAEIVRPMMDEAATGVSAREALRDLLHTILPASAAMKAQWRFWVAFWERGAHSPQVQRVMRERYFEYMNRVASVIRRAQEQGEAPRDLDVDQVAREIVATIDGLAVQVLLGAAKFTGAAQRQFVDTMLDARLGAVAASPPKASRAAG
ncbi:MAG: TetR family transcriptional regulator C-terminal domain-containing protein [Phenylobacterium sp.]|uniref:TetR/AcrR family transcriptional regulator n=1 Tax=Phenylobacterium sp. TaxID=1871053 RepID=UPI001A399806|nr:TetR family transcriptional regulator C-terminal domain-containing protein [Phenylobacterium sp.]MBL8773560.1 TetR family transcriptional regulator C-terminal domain-containing protein [Phenylobacterium sp.]